MQQVGVGGVRTQTEIHENMALKATNQAAQWRQKTAAACGAAGPGASGNSGGSSDSPHAGQGWRSDGRHSLSEAAAGPWNTATAAVAAARGTAEEWGSPRAERQYRKEGSNTEQCRAAPGGLCVIQNVVDPFNNSWLPECF